MLCFENLFIFLVRHSFDRSGQNVISFVPVEVKTSVFLALIINGYDDQISVVYIHNWSLQPFSQDYWPSFSYHLYISDRTYSLKSTPNYRFLKTFFMAMFYIFARNLLGRNHRRNTFRILFWCLLILFVFVNFIHKWRDGPTV